MSSRESCRPPAPVAWTPSAESGVEASVLARLQGLMDARHGRRDELVATMLLTADDLQRIVARTVAHYDQRAQTYWEGTRDHDVSQNIAALLQSIEAAPPFYLFDFGCGPGRGLETFKRLGHRATGIEGSSQLAAMARANCGCEVLAVEPPPSSLRSPTSSVAP